MDTDMKYNFTDIIERNGKDAIAAEKIPCAVRVRKKVTTGMIMR